MIYLDTASFIQDKARTIQGKNIVELLEDLGFTKYDFRGLDFSPSSLEPFGVRNADFSNQNLEHINFSHADLTSANFTGSNLRFSNFESADLSNADFSGANLKNANFRRANLYNTSFDGAEMLGANFDEANIRKSFSAIEKAKNILPKFRSISKLLLIIFIVFFLISYVTYKKIASNSNQHAIDSSFDEVSINMMRNFEEVKAKNKSALFVIFYTEIFPGYNEIFESDNVRDYFGKHFNIISVNRNSVKNIADPSGSIISEKNFANKVGAGYGVKPAFVFIRLAEKNMIKYFKIENSENTEELMLYAHYIVEGEIDEMSFDEYKRKIKAQQ